MCLADWVFLGALVVIIGLPCTYYSGRGTTVETMNKQSTPVTNLIDIFLSILKLTKFHRVLRRNIQKMKHIKRPRSPQSDKRTQQKMFEGEITISQ